MNNVSHLNTEWLLAWERAMLIEEAKEQKRFAEFYSQIPELVIRHKIQESLLPLKFVINEHKKGS